MVLSNEQYRMKLNGVKTPNKQFNKHLIRVDIGFWPLEKRMRPVRDSLKETNVHELKAVGGNKL